MVTPANANQFTIAPSMTATRERQGPQVVEPSVRDEALTLGPDGRLVVIVSHPSGGHSLARATTVVPGTVDPAFMILNAGVLHRVGPHRLHVVLARRMASTGILGARLDLGGIGDSTAGPDAGSFRDSAVADTRLAMTGLGDACGVQRFVLFGVCAGADNAIATALADPRVMGIILVDPPMYPTPWSRIRDLRARVVKRGSAREMLRWGILAAERRLRRMVARLDRRGEAAPSGGRELPPADVHRRQLTTLVDRGVHILAIFSGIHGVRYNDPDQLFELCPELRGRLDTVYYPDANHTFTELAAQARLIDRVVRWMAKHPG
jgi:pimeloyl-ACP methyl ester carboxylesterase